MATFYLADEKKHSGAVALKVLLPGLAASLGVERFLKEIQIAARLQHPHILTLHDSGEAGGFLYYVMPYIEGASLRQQLEGPPRRSLSPQQALAIAEPVADALSYAHRMGVLHRDIKPENILFSQGHPIVADFGIAKAVSTAGGANLPRPGFPLGTPRHITPRPVADGGRGARGSVPRGRREPSAPADRSRLESRRRARTRVGDPSRPAHCDDRGADRRADPRGIGTTPALRSD